MKLRQPNHKPLAKGQVWQTCAAHIEIVRLGKDLIHYRIANRLKPRRMSAQISGIEPLLKYLDANRATLVAESIRN